MLRKRLVGQLLRSHLTIVCGVVLVAGWCASKSLEETLISSLEDRMESMARLVASRGAKAFSGDMTELDQFAAQASHALSGRFTIIRTDGEVVYDSQAEVARMENHARRPEIAEALSGAPGRSIRYSTTFNQRMLYVAVPVRDEGRVVGVVRAAIPASDIDAELSRLRWQVAAASAIILAVALTLAWTLSRRAARPVAEIARAARSLADGDRNVRFPAADTDELVGLTESIRQLAQQIEERSHVIGRKGHEQEAVLASMVEGVLAVDPQEIVISLNRAAADLIGSRQSDVPGRSLQEVLRNADLRRFATRALQSDVPIEDDVVLRGEQEKILRIRGTALRDGAGRSVGAVIVLNDVTRFRHLENVRQDFVANVSHELKTPIASIKGFVETLLDGAMEHPDDALRFLKIIARQADRLNAIIEDLLSLAKIEQNERAADLPLIDSSITNVLEAALADCQSKAAARQIDVQLVCDPSLRAAINPPLLEQAVANLLDNAVKYSEPLQAVQIRAQRLANEVIIAVIDEGCGIESEHLPRLFERFYRVDRARSRKLGGTGLGLSIVKHIVQAHRGQITVISRMGKGSTFTIHLPETSESA
jgi:two-component system, OmpR family, phosphate regulon sensor histidine kinase PhoR